MTTAIAPPRTMTGFSSPASRDQRRPLAPVKVNTALDRQFSRNERISDPQSSQAYYIEHFLGKGGFARCFAVRSENPHQQHHHGRDASSTSSTATASSYRPFIALKIVPKRRLSDYPDYHKMHREINIHSVASNLRHECIVHFLGYFEDVDHFYLKLELCRNETLLDLINKSQFGLEETQCKRYFKNILDAVSYLHDHGILHRDIKPGNVFVGLDDRAKLGDFGLAIMKRQAVPGSVSGTPNYLAPEVLKQRGHSTFSDVWALGCTLFCMLTTRPPFEMDTIDETYKCIEGGAYRFPRDSNVSFAARQLVSRCLHTSVNRRASMSDILEDHWLANVRPSTSPYPVATVQQQHQQSTPTVAATNLGSAGSSAYTDYTGSSHGAVVSPAAHSAALHRPYPLSRTKSVCDVDAARSAAIRDELAYRQSQATTTQSYRAGQATEFGACHQQQQYQQQSPYYYSPSHEHNQQQSQNQANQQYAYQLGYAQYQQHQLQQSSQRASPNLPQMMYQMNVHGQDAQDPTSAYYAQAQAQQQYQQQLQTYQQQVQMYQQMQVAQQQYQQGLHHHYHHQQEPTSARFAVPRPKSTPSAAEQASKRRPRSTFDLRSECSLRDQIRIDMEEQAEQRLAATSVASTTPMRPKTAAATTTPTTTTTTKPATTTPSTSSSRSARRSAMRDSGFGGSDTDMSIMATLDANLNRIVCDVFEAAQGRLHAVPYKLPPVFVTRWVDYSNRLGFACELADSNICAKLINGTCATISPSTGRITYASSPFMSPFSLPLEEARGDPTLNEAMQTIDQISSYMKTELNAQAPPPGTSYNQHRGSNASIHLVHFHYDYGGSGVVMMFNDSTIQVNLTKSRSKVVMWRVPLAELGVAGGGDFATAVAVIAPHASKPPAGYVILPEGVTPDDVAQLDDVDYEQDPFLLNRPIILEAHDRINPHVFAPRRLPHVTEC